MNGPRRLRDDPAFFEATGVDLAAESETLMPHDLPRLKRRVMGAVARGAAPRLAPTRGGPGLGHLVALMAVGGTIVGALSVDPAGRQPTVAAAERASIAMQHSAATLEPEINPVATHQGLAIAASEAPLPATPTPPEVAEIAPPPAPEPAAAAPRRARRVRVATPPAPAPEPTPEAADDAPAVAEEAPEATTPEPPAPKVVVQTPVTALDKDLLGALAETLRRKTFK